MKREAENVGPQLCVAALITHAETGRVLLIRHGTRGTWELPGGKMLRHETLRDAAAREVLEETGVEMYWPLGLEAPRHTVFDGVAGVVVVVLRGFGKGEPIAGSDAAEARWFEADDVPWAEVSRVASLFVLEEWRRHRTEPMRPRCPKES